MILAFASDAERNFGVRGVLLMLRGRFLEGAPPLAGLEMVIDIDPDAVSRFFVETARRWVRGSIERGC